MNIISHDNFINNLLNRLDKTLFKVKIFKTFNSIGTKYKEIYVYQKFNNEFYKIATFKLSDDSINDCDHTLGGLENVINKLCSVEYYKQSLIVNELFKLNDFNNCQFNYEYHLKDYVIEAPSVIEFSLKNVDEPDVNITLKFNEGLKGTITVAKKINSYHELTKTVALENVDVIIKDQLDYQKRYIKADFDESFTLNDFKTMITLIIKELSH